MSVPPSTYNEDEDDEYRYYRGMRLNYQPGSKRMYWRSPREDGFHVTVTSGHEEILEKLAAIRPEGGSFRITELNEVLIKVTAPGETIPEIPKFVTVLNNPLTFENVENVPNDLSPGDLWEGIYDGTRYSFVPMSTGEQNIWWSTVEDFSVRYKLLARMPDELFRNLRMHKSIGGRFCITPEGYVLTLVEKGILGAHARNRYKELYDSGNWDPLRLIDSKEKRTGLFPIFIGRWEIDSNNFKFKPPKKWGEALQESERNRMLQTISGLLNPSVMGMAHKEKDEDKELEEFPASVPLDFSHDDEDGDTAPIFIPTEDDPSVKDEMLMHEEE